MLQAGIHKDGLYDDFHPFVLRLRKSLKRVFAIRFRIWYDILALNFDLNSHSVEGYNFER
jgi:hypothetical protein